MKIYSLDCTLRDGGNFNNWFFSNEDIYHIITNLDQAGIDIIEIGYIGGSGSNKAKSVGSVANCSPEFLNKLPQTKQAELALMVVPSVCELSKLHDIDPQLVPWIRVASYPQSVENALPYVEYLKNRGFQVSFNLMAASYVNHKEIVEIAKESHSAGADVFYMADSYGALNPDDVGKRIRSIVNEVHCQVGFHGHNNLGLAFPNALEALNSGASFIDTSLCGMARGAGNLPTEQFISTMNHWNKYDMKHKIDPLLKAAEYVLHSIIKSPLKISKPEIICGLSNIHYYFYDLIASKCKENNLNLLEVSQLLGKTLPEKVDHSYIDSVINQILDRSVTYES
ncbi:beta/alpha barrel domain-containing protein [Priestia filamentosa]|uniref:aldolase n=1 Tax=Priestia filamentosa TaxID=1402861 RepID=UPI003982AB4C